MSLLTDFAENSLCDMARGQGLSLPASNWFIGMGSAASDGSFTELTGAAYARVAVPRSTSGWDNTQGSGTTAASNGSSHKTANSSAVTFPTVGAGGWGTQNALGVFSALTGGNCWVWVPTTAAARSAGSTPVIAAGGISLTLGISGGMTDYLANALIDKTFRGIAFTYPAIQYGRLFTVAPTNAGGGTEIIGASYARPAIAGSLAAWSGTQGAGTTAASAGTLGRISNNAGLSFPAPLENQGDAAAFGLQDAASAGNLLWWKALASPLSILSGGSAAAFDPDSLGLTFS